MLRGLYTSASQLLRLQRRQEAIAGNLANATTTGFRADVPEGAGFAAVLQERLNGLEPAGARSLWGAEWIGAVGTGVQPDRYVLRTAPGPLRESDNPLDLALAGPGFFVVATPTGEGYTRDGTFRRAADGRLVTGAGLPVLGENGPITLGPGEVQVTSEGVIVQNGQTVARLRVVDFPPRYQLPSVNGPVRLAPGAYTLTPDGQLLQGAEPMAQLASFTLAGPGGELQLAPGQLVVGEDGTLTVDGQPRGRLSRAEGLGPDQAIRTAGPLLVLPPGAEAPTPVAAPQVRQGMLEGSNVDLTKTLTDMLAVARAYEASQRAIKLADEAARRAVEDVGRVGG
ncbi:MAG: flagellar hook-basal body complex protein [Chloroflexi bacterium]|nr:flagellar hook-basal body complex protein [Chloroflexota bacterium]